MHKSITYILIALIILIIAGIFHYNTVKIEKMPPVIDDPTYTEIIAIRDKGIEKGRIEIVTAIRKEIITTGQLKVDIPMADGSVKSLILIIDQNAKNIQ